MGDNMETLLIADDEAAIREGLKYIIDWEAEGFRLCAEAGNGEDALAKILALRPSLVLLDVKMPKMHGTEVIRQAREQGFTGKCIILSGYSDFAYAQSAIRSGVSFYLLKPIDEDELLDSVRKIRLLIDDEKKNTSKLSNLKQKARDVILRELITDTLSAPLLPEDLSSLHLQADVYQIVICEDFQVESRNAPYTLAELLRVTNKDNSTFDHISIDSHDVVLLKGAYGLKKLNEFLMHFEEQTPQEGSPLGSMFLTIGRPVYAVTDIFQSYSDAVALLHRRFFCPQEQHYLDYEDLPKKMLVEQTTKDSAPAPTVFDDALLSFYSDRFIDYITTFNRNMIAHALSALETELNESTADISAIRMFLIDIYLRTKEKIAAIYSSADIPFLANSAVIEFIHGQNYLYEIIRYLSEQFEMMMNASGNPSRDTILDDVIFYINHNYRDNIKLETIAPLFGYNSAYLGKIFNKTVGESFNSYVDHKRIELSKKLLQENSLKVYEISEQVGYKNVDYFHKKFKKYVGESPAEYRKRSIFL